MPDATIKLFRLFDEAGNVGKFESTDVFDKATGQTVAEFMAAAPTTAQINGLIDTALDALKKGDLQTLEDSVSALSTTVNTFLTGEPDDNGTLDRLKELVAAINANKGSIDALVADHVKKTEIINDLNTGGADKVLSAEMGKSLKALVDALHGATGIAIGATLETATSFTGKLRIVVEDYTPPSA